MQKDTTSFLKFDGTKVRPTLFPKKAKYAALAVLEYGAQKYAPNNWMKATAPEDLQRYRDALERHWDEYIEDNTSVDPESGLPHLHHALCNMVFLATLDEVTNEVLEEE